MTPPVATRPPGRAPSQGAARRSNAPTAAVRPRRHVVVVGSHETSPSLAPLKAPTHQPYNTVRGIVNSNYGI
jgi:hypothetical protein